MFKFQIGQTVKLIDLNMKTTWKIAIPFGTVIRIDNGFDNMLYYYVEFQEKALYLRASSIQGLNHSRHPLTNIFK